jgi:heme/copper-type cytochrome/quinol oxidase subunit 2
MLAIIILIAALVIVSCMSMTKEERQEAFKRSKRLEPLWIGLIVAQLAFIFWPRHH